MGNSYLGAIFRTTKVFCTVTFIFMIVKHKKGSWHYLKQCSFFFYKKNIQMKTSDPDIFMNVALNIACSGTTTSWILSFSSLFSLTLFFLSILSLLSLFSSIFTHSLSFISSILVYFNTGLLALRSVGQCVISFCVMFSDSFKHIERP